MIYETATLTPTYDIVLDDTGKLSWEKEGMSVATRAFLDISCNDNWLLDNLLGINWVDATNTGLLQIKTPEVDMINALERKLMSIGGIQSVDAIIFTPLSDRKVRVDITCTIENGEQITIGNEVDRI